jgi:hypothetical protein
MMLARICPPWRLSLFRARRPRGQSESRFHPDPTQIRPGPAEWRTGGFKGEGTFSLDCNEISSTFMQHSAIGPCLRSNLLLETVNFRGRWLCGRDPGTSTPEFKERLRVPWAKSWAAPVLIACGPEGEHGGAGSWRRGPSRAASKLGVESSGCRYGLGAMRAPRGGDGNIAQALGAGLGYRRRRRNRLLDPGQQRV